MTTKHLFLGGVADGLQIDVHPARQFVQIQHDGERLTQYRRRTLDTRNGPVDVFTHGIECPVAALLTHYAQKHMIPALDTEVVNDASRYRALLAAEPALLRKKPMNTILRWMRGKIPASKAHIDSALDHGLNAGIIKI
jgi:hypothetical protein